MRNKWLHILLAVVMVASCMTIATYAENESDHSDLNLSSIVVNDELQSTANSLGIYQEDFFASYYFSQLYQNYGYNARNSCNYVALGMLLSYYDTFWDDTIIPSPYESITMLSSSYFSVEGVNSPGGGKRNIGNLFSAYLL